MEAKRKIIIHSLVFSPDGVSTAYLYNDIALKLQDSNYEVVVITTTPHYNIVEDELEKQPLSAKLFGLYYTSNFNGIKVIHIPQKKFKKTYVRLLGFIYWHFLSLIIGLCIRKVALILSPSPPLTVGIVSLIIAKIKGAKVVYNVQEIYPDFLINAGNLKNKFAIKILRMMESSVYNYSDSVTTIDQQFYNTISPRFYAKNKSNLTIIPNFVDTDLFKPINGTSLELNRDLFPDKPEVLKLMYAGNIGLAQDWQPLIEIAKRVSHKPIEFWVIGEGVLKKKLVSMIEEAKLSNIHILPYQNRNTMPSLIAYADLHFIFMTPEMDSQGFPSKVYSIMASGKPMLILTGNETPLDNFLKNAGVSFIVNDSTFETKCENVIEVLNNVLEDKQILNSMGAKGVEYINKNYSKQIVTKNYAELIRKLVS